MFQDLRFIYRLLLGFVWMAFVFWQGQGIALANYTEDRAAIDGEIEAMQPTVQLNEAVDDWVGFTVRIYNNGDTDVEGAVLHVGMPDSVQLPNSHNQGWVMRIDNARFFYLKPLGTMEANSTKELVLMLLVRDDIDDGITRIPTPSLQITANGTEVFALGMGAGGDDVIIIDEVSAFDDSMQTPTDLPTDAEPRAVQDVYVFLPIIF